MDELLLHLENSITQFTDTPYQHLRTSIRNAWNILNKYYTLANLSPAYFTSIALHLEMKMEYFLSEWSSQSDWIQMAQKSVENYQLDNWKTQEQSTSFPEVRPDENEPEWKRRKRAQLHSNLQDPLQRYLEKNPEDIADPLQFWVEKENDPQYSQLAAMGIAIQSIPGMSAKPERVFSSSKLLISDR